MDNSSFFGLDKPLFYGIRLMNINDKIRTLREFNHWSQEEMAEKMQMSTNTYARFERGETRLDLSKLQRIAAIFQLDVVDLIANEKQNLFFQIGDENQQHNTNYNNTSADVLNAEIEKLQLIIQHKDELLAQKENELATFKIMLDLLQQKING